MTGNHSDDLLSAFYDGEVGEAERAEAERRLQASPQSQRELEDYRALSQLLQSLPSESLPEGFRREVMQAAERRMLLPESEPAATIAVSGRRSRRWWYGAAALATSAAAVLLAVGLSDQDPSLDVAEMGFRVASDNSDFHDPNERMEERIARTDLAVAGRDAAAGRASRESEVLDRSSPASDERVESLARFGRRSGSDGTLPTPGQPSETDAMDSVRPLDELGHSISPAAESPADSPVDVRMARRGRDGVDGFGDALPGQRLVFGTDLQTADVGAVVEALDTSGQQVSVVKLTVVDRREGLENLQLVLTKNFIATEPSSELAREQESAAEAGEEDPPALKDEQEGLVAVFVEATDDQIKSVLMGMKGEEQFCELTVEKPIQLAELDAYSGNQLRAQRKTPARMQYGWNVPQPTADDARGAGAQLGARPMVRDREGAPGAVERNESAASAENRSIAKGGVAGQSARDNYAQSRQLQMRVPADVFHVESLGKPPINTLAEPLEQRLATGESLSLRLMHRTGPVKAPPVRPRGAPLPVLFVVVERAGSEAAQPSSGTETPN